MSRFQAIMTFNDNAVSFAIGDSKKDSKLNACRHGLAGIAPEFYKEWLNEHPECQTLEKSSLLVLNPE